MEDIFIFGLTGGEAFVVGFIIATIVSAPWWPRAGARLLGGARPDPAEPPVPRED